MQFRNFEVRKRNEYIYSKRIGWHLPSLGMGEDFQLESVLEAIQMLRGRSLTGSFLQSRYKVGGMTSIKGHRNQARSSRKIDVLSGH